jgi:hypothetical protein
LITNAVGITALAGVAALGIAAIAATPAAAVPMQYTITGQATGQLGASSFKDAAFTIDLIGDSDNIVTKGFSTIDPLDSASMTIAGLGTAEIQIATRLGANKTVVFFSRTGKSSADLFDMILASQVDISAAFAPVSATNVFALNQFNNVQTSLGSLSVSAADKVTFEAAGWDPDSGDQAAVPVPASVLFLAGAIGSLAVQRNLRIRRAQA